MKEINTIHLKYVDDLALAEAIDMKTQLTHVPVEERTLPDAYRARTGHKLINEKSNVYDQLKKTQLYADQNKMKLNIKKTKLMLFNPCSSKDFMPEIVINNTRIDLVEEIKLLGVMLTSDLSWAANTRYIVGRCNSKIWMLRRLKKLGASSEDLLEVYFKQIRSVAEFAAPVWNSALTGDDIINLERLQKTVLHIILGDQYKSYNSALKLTGLARLSERRKTLCTKLAKKCLKNPKFSNWFKVNPI